MKTSIPDATIARLPVYLRCLADLASVDAKCSSDDLAEAAGVRSAQVRKDFSYLGSYGTRGVGYDIDDLGVQIRKVLGLTRGYPVVVIGAGNLGSALTNYEAIDNWGFSVVAILDIDETKIGTPVDGLTVEPIGNLAKIVAERDIEIGIITAPAPAAQGIADQLAAVGISSILNFAPTVIRPPEGVRIHRVDISHALGILAYHRTADQKPTADKRQAAARR
jgi:redox-sensing transcriptional repressor